MMEDNIFYTTHELKILPKWFDDVVNEVKNFEIRRADRPYRVGDRLLLREYEKGRFTGRRVTREIEYIYQGDGTYGLSEEFCILGLKRSVPAVNMKQTGAGIQIGYVESLTI